MNHIMVDIETLGTRPTSIFLSLAAVQFDINTGRLGNKFYETINLKSAQEAGLTFDAGTLQWWMSQDDSTRKLMFEGSRELPTVLNRFSNFIDIVHAGAKDIKLWGNSAAFDLGILGNAYDVLCIPRPWKFYDERCYRTVASEFRELTSLIKNSRPHHPLADCEYQIEKLCLIWKVINSEPVDKAKWLQAKLLLTEIKLNSSPAVSGLREKVNRFFGTPTNERGYAFEKPESSGHSFTEGMEERPTKISKAKDEENE